MVLVSGRRFPFQSSGLPHSAKSGGGRSFTGIFVGSRKICNAVVNRREARSPLQTLWMPARGLEPSPRVSVHSRSRSSSFFGVVVHRPGNAFRQRAERD
jgi:hypothetical protein